MDRTLKIDVPDGDSRPWRVLAAVLPGVALTMSHWLMLDVPRADIIDALDTDRYRIHWITGSYLVGSAAGMCATQFTTGLLGLRRAFLFGLLLYTLAGGACGWINEIVWMTPLRLLQGFGNGQLISVGMVMVWHAFPRRREGPMAAYGVCTYVPTALGTVAGGLLAWYLSWRYIFFTILPAGVAMWAFAWLILPSDDELAELAAAGDASGSGRTEENRPRRARFDFVGFPLWVISVGALNVTLDMAQYWGWIRSRHFVVWCATFILAFGGFVAWGLLARDPVINLRTLRHRNAAMGLLVKMFFTINLVTLFGLMSVYMVDLRQYQWWQSALVVLAAAAAMIFSVLVGLVIGTPANRKARMFLGLGVMALATWQLMAVDVFTSKFWQAGVLCGWGLGAGLVIEPALVTIFEGLSFRDTLPLSGAFNILRAVPAYVALVTLSTFWVQDTDAYFDLMRQTVRYNTPIVQHTLDHSRKRFITMGSPHHWADRQAYELMNNWTEANARAFALRVVFRDLTYLTLLGLVPVLLIRTRRDDEPPA